MTVYDFAVRKRGLDLREDLDVFVDYTGVIHHLGEAEDPRVLVPRLEIPGPEDGPGFIDGGGRDARREHEEYLHRQARACLEHVTDAVVPGDVRDLVGVCDDRPGAVSHANLGEFLGGQHRGFDVDVAVDEGRGENLVRTIDDAVGGIVVADAEDDAGIVEKDVRLHQGIGENVNDFPVLEQSGHEGLLYVGIALHFRFSRLWATMGKGKKAVSKDEK